MKNEVMVGVHKKRKGAINSFKNNLFSFIIPNQILYLVILFKNKTTSIYGSR
jgi:hypothetical protein